VFPVSVVVGAAVPAAVCCWGLCPRCPGVGRCLSGVNISSPMEASRDTSSLDGPAADETPRGYSSVDETRRDETSADETLVYETAADETAGDETAADEIRRDETSADGGTSILEGPQADETAEGQTASDGTSRDEIAVDEIRREDSSVDETGRGETPGGPSTLDES